MSADSGPHRPDAVRTTLFLRMEMSCVQQRDKSV